VPEFIGGDEEDTHWNRCYGVAGVIYSTVARAGGTSPDYEAACKKSKPSIVIATPPRLTPVQISQKPPTRLNVSIAALPDLCPN
jgi:hypothetical protein